MNLNIIDKIQAWRFGQTGITGLNEMQNNAKMVVVLLTPFLAVWFTFQYSIVQGWVPEQMGGWLLLGTVFGWLAYCGLYWAYVSTDASKYKCLPQCTIFFKDGFDRTYNMPIKEDGIVVRHRFADGSIGVEIFLLYRYSYIGPDMNFPYIFKSLLVRIPSEIGNTFKFVSKGEYWHKGMIVTTNNCEHISIYGMGWIEENGQWKIVGVLGDCSYNYAQALKYFNDAKDKKLIDRADANWLLYKTQLQKFDELNQYTAQVEDALDSARTMGGKKIKDMVDKNMSAIRDMVHRIEDVQEPLFRRIFKFGTIVKVLVIVVGVWAFLHYGLKVI